MVKRPDELAKMQEAGRLLASVFGLLDRTVLAGMTTMAVNDLVEDYIVNHLHARPASKGQYGYAFALNCSRNHVVCHGAPSADERLEDGDIVNLDITLEKHGYIADSSKTYLIGKVKPAARRLVEVTYEAMWKGIRSVRAGAHLGDIGHAIERHAKRHDYTVVRQYCGHGIGREMHQEPEVLHFGKPGTGLRLREGMVFTIEPMLNQGSARVKHAEDGWTVLTSDGKLSAQFEHTVAVTRTGFSVLTLRPEEKGMVDGRT